MADKDSTKQKGNISTFFNPIVPTGSQPSTPKRKAGEAGMDVHDNRSDESMFAMLKQVLEEVSTLKKSMPENWKSDIQAMISDSVKAHVTPIAQEVKTLRSENVRLKQELTSIKDAVNENNQYSRKNSVRILGLKESADENCENLIVTELNNKIRSVKLDVTDIEVAHRLGRKREGTDRNKPRAIICKFKFRSVKMELCKYRSELKGSNVFVFDDLSPQNHDLLFRLKAHDGINQAWAVNGKVFGKANNGSITRFAISDDLDAKIADM